MLFGLTLFFIFLAETSFFLRSGPVGVYDTRYDNTHTSAQRTSWTFLAGIKNSIFLSRRHKRKHLTHKNSSNI